MRPSGVAGKLRARQNISFRRRQSDGAENQGNWRLRLVSGLQARKCLLLWIRVDSGVGKLLLDKPLATEVVHLWIV